MAEPQPISLGAGSNKARFGQAGVCQHINSYIEQTGKEGKTTDIAVAINGWELFATLTNGDGVRRMLQVDDSNMIVVAGSGVFRVSPSGGTVTALGGVGSDGFLTMAHNRKTPFKQTAIVVDGLWYIFENITLTQGTDSDLPPPLAVVEIDGYFIFLISDGRWFLAGPNEGTSIDPLDFAEAEAGADDNVMAAVRGRTLIIFGSETAEFWDPNGSADFPFSRTTVISGGCYAAGTVGNVMVTKGGEARDMVVYAGTDKEGAYTGIMALQGYQPTVISTPEVDRLVRDEADKTLLRCCAWTEDGHGFYTLSGTAFSVTWDGKTGQWDDRKSFGRERWNAQCAATFGGMTLFGHETTNKIYRSLPTAYDEAGEPIVWQIQPPPVHANMGGFIVDQVYADMITGVGLNSGDETDDDPELLFSYSRDGGFSWAAERRLKLGRQGEKWRRVRINALGKFDHNGVTFRFRCSAKVARGLQQVLVAVTPLGS